MIITLNEQGGLVEAGHLEGNADLVAVMKVGTKSLKRARCTLTTIQSRNKLG